MPDVKVPVIGNVPKPALFMGVGAVVVVGGYMYYRHKQTAISAAYGYGAGAYGDASQSSFYGYGFNYGDYSGTGGGGGVTPYPVGAEYGYGAYGYGYYNPYTGQWIGPTQQQPPGKPPPVKSKFPGLPKYSGWYTKSGHRYYYSRPRGTIGQWIGKGKSRRYVKTPV